MDQLLDQENQALIYFLPDFGTCQWSQQNYEKVE